MRVLGTWIGNAMDATAPWEPILDKIKKALDHYNKGFPTLKERKMIIQIIVRGYMQFLTKAQGMPSQIKTAVTKLIRNFIWEDTLLPCIAL